MSVNPQGQSSTLSPDSNGYGDVSHAADDEAVSVNTYGNFADIYDGFGSEEFCLSMVTHVMENLEKYRLPRGAEILDIACGTGVITTELAKEGYQMIGLDLSKDMLRHAQQRAARLGVNIRFVRADMRSFELQQKTPCIISTHDSLDHLFEDDELDQAFQQIAKALRPQGLFLFDMNCWEGIRHLDGRTVFVENPDRSGAYYLIAEDRTLETNIVGFLRVEGNLYERFDETLFQRCYSNEEIEERLDRFGLELLERIPIQYLKGDIFKQLWVTRMPGLDIPDLF